MSKIEDLKLEKLVLGTLLVYVTLHLTEDLSILPVIRSPTLGDLLAGR